MKAVFGLAVVVCVGLLAYWFAGAPKSKGPSLAIPLAWGNVAGNEIEMHAIIGVGLAHTSRKGEKGTIKPVSWDEWIAKHCVLKSATGEVVKLQRRMNSLMIPYRDVQNTVGTEEFFIVAKMKTGTAYTFDYTIERPDPETYRCQFAAPTQAEKTAIHSFELVKQ